MRKKAFGYLGLTKLASTSGTNKANRFLDAGWHLLAFRVEAYKFGRFKHSEPVMPVVKSRSVEWAEETEAAALASNEPNAETESD